MKKKLILFILILCMANAVLAVLPHGSRQIRFNVEKVPLSLNGWQGSVSAADTLTRKILGTDDVYDFLYHRDGTQLHLSVVYYPQGQPSFHMPEGCTVGAGEKILSQEWLTVDGAWHESQAAYLKVLNNSGKVTHHLYAFASDEKLSGDYINFRLHLLGLGIRRGIQACALIRVSAHQTNPAVDVERVLSEFWYQISLFLKSAMSPR